MKVNENTKIVGKKVILVPYEAHHVPKYHTWMQDDEIRRFVFKYCVLLWVFFRHAIVFVMRFLLVTTMILPPILGKGVYFILTCLAVTPRKKNQKEHERPDKEQQP